MYLGKPEVLSQIQMWVCNYFHSHTIAQASTISRVVSNGTHNNEILHQNKSYLSLWLDRSIYLGLFFCLGFFSCGVQRLSNSKTSTYPIAFRKPPASQVLLFISFLIVLVYQTDSFLKNYFTCCYFTAHLVNDGIVQTWSPHYLGFAIWISQEWFQGKFAI